MATLANTILILCLIQTTLACWAEDGGSWESGGSTEKEESSTTPSGVYSSTTINGTNGAEDPMFHGNLSDPKKWYSHWKEPEEGVYSVSEYKQFIDDYKMKEKQKIEEDLKAAGGRWSARPDGAGPGWPTHWYGLGPGSSGAAPPPWAYVPQSSGKADMCFLPPLRGECQNAIYSIRWGFNLYLDTCAEFVFSGCGGNANNFLSKKRCIEACVGVPTSNCVSETDLLLDSFDLTDPNTITLD